MNLLTNPKFLLFFVILKDGINFRGYDHYGIPAAKSLPHFVDFYSTSYGDLVISHLLHTYSRFSWVILHTLLTIILILLLFYIGISAKNRKSNDSLLFLLLLSQLTTLALQEIGFYDIVTLIGGLLAAINVRKRVPFLLSVLVLNSGNPEQSFISILSLLILVFLFEKDRRTFLNVFLGLFLSLINLIFVFLWSKGNGRESYLGPEILKASLHSFLIAMPFSVLAILGCLNFLVFAFRKFLSRTEMTAFITSIIFIPGVLSAIALDGSRVAVSISCAPLIYILKFMVEERNFRIDNRDKMFMFLFPSILVWGPGVVSLPWGRFFRL